MSILLFCKQAKYYLVIWFIIIMMSVKITLVFTILALAVLQNVSSASFQKKDSEESENEDDEYEDDEYEKRFEDSYKDEGNDADANNQNIIREYHYSTDFLYSGQVQSGQLKSNGKNVVTGEYYFVENGKEYKVSYVADENGYRPKYTATETTKDSPPTYQGKIETGEYAFQKKSNRYKIKYIVDEKGFRPTEVEVEPITRNNEYLPPDIDRYRYQGKKETGEYTFQKNDKRYKIKYVVDENGYRPTEIEVKPLPRLSPPPTRPPPNYIATSGEGIPPVPYDPLIVASFLGG